MRSKHANAWWPAGLLAVPAWHAAYATQYMSVEEAQRAAFAATAVFRPGTALDPAIAAELGSPGWSPQTWQVIDGEATAGWFFVDRVIGKTELITYAVALDANGTLKSIEILEYRETHGSEVRLAAWRKQFVGRTASDPVMLDRDIKNISGATLSCRHVTEGVHRLLQVYARVLHATRS